MKQKLNTSCHSPTGPSEHCKSLLLSRCAHSYNRSEEELRPQVGWGRPRRRGHLPRCLTYTLTLTTLTVEGSIFIPCVTEPPSSILH